MSQIAASWRSTTCWPSSMKSDSTGGSDANTARPQAQPKDWVDEVRVVITGGFGFIGTMVAANC
jgi:hypothetical protein